ncbi:MAG: YciI family protein [Pyrinomonadaceae bacterium]|nr:YciI family protein [Pyrinomonadaceae bacterium]
MKTHAASIVALLLSCYCLFISPANGQTSPVNTPPTFDANLAKKLGADEYGMKNYVFCILKTGPKDASIKDEKQRAGIFGGHMANMKRLADAGKLVVAGPFGKNERGYRGIFVFDVASVEEAEKLVATDPVIKSGMMTAELTLWYGSAALMATADIHKRIQKTAF